MSLQSLPDELAEWICNYCSESEIKNLRLTCRALNKVASEHLLSEVVGFLSRESLQACREISAHDVFARTARSLWIQADRPEEGKDFESWDWERRNSASLMYLEEAYYEVFGMELSDRNRRESPLVDALYEKIKNREESKQPALTEQQVRELYDRAKTLTSDAVEIVSDGSLFNSLRELFAHCSNLQAIDLTVCDKFRESRLRKSTTKYNKTFLQGFLRPVGDPDRRTSGGEAMRQLVLAAAAASEKTPFQPKVLRLGNVSFQLEGIFEPLQAFFQGLEELEWQFPLPYEDEGGTVDVLSLNTFMADSDEEKDFITLMHAAPQLKKLRLELPGFEEEPFEIPLESFVGDMTWHNLTHVHLSNFAAPPKELSNFLSRHAGTLEKVLLANVALVDGEWPVWFTSFAGKLPHIREFELRGRFEDGEGGAELFYCFGQLGKERGNKYGKRVSRFLIAGGEECPAVPDEDEEWSDGDDGEG